MCFKPKISPMLPDILVTGGKQLRQIPFSKQMRLLRFAHLGRFCLVFSTFSDAVLSCQKLTSASDAEISAGVICCCFPVLPQLYRKRIAPSLISLKSRVFSMKTETSPSLHQNRSHTLQTDDSSKAQLSRSRDYTKIREGPSTVGSKGDRVYAWEDVEGRAATAGTQQEENGDLEMGPIRTDRTFRGESSSSRHV